MNLTKIKVIGLGRAGCNFVDHMIKKKLKGVEFIGKRIRCLTLFLKFDNLRLCQD